VRPLPIRHDLKLNNARSDVPEARAHARAAQGLSLNAASMMPRPGLLARHRFQRGADHRPASNAGPQRSSARVTRLAARRVRSTEKFARTGELGSRSGCLCPRVLHRIRPAAVAAGETSISLRIRSICLARQSQIHSLSTSPIHRQSTYLACHLRYAPQLRRQEGTSPSRHCQQRYDSMIVCTWS
jgi:hypothetical protein